jgi:hypothetical protein
MATVPRQHITQRKIAEHVQRLGEHYPPIPWILWIERSSGQGLWPGSSGT